MYSILHGPSNYVSNGWSGLSFHAFRLRPRVHFIKLENKKYREFSLISSDSIQNNSILANCLSEVFNSLSEVW